MRGEGEESVQEASTEEEEEEEENTKKEARISCQDQTLIKNFLDLTL